MTTLERKVNSLEKEIGYLKTRISFLVPEDTEGEYKSSFIKEIEDLFPQVMLQFAGNLKNELNLEQMVSSKIAAVSPEQIENLLYKNISKEIRVASLFSAAIGLLIGILQLSIILLID